jgi:hypothetical protein
VTRIEADVAEMKPNVDLIPVIKAAVTDQNRQIMRIDLRLDDHEQRLRSLEKAA